MCRLLAYWGTPVPVTDLVVTPEHSLLVQCTASGLQTSGTVNPDGWGIAWYPETPAASAADEAPSRTPVPVGPVHARRRRRPGRAGRDSGPAVRGSCAPQVAGFAHRGGRQRPVRAGPATFAHNGFVAGYRQGRREHGGPS